MTIRGRIGWAGGDIGTSVVLNPPQSVVATSSDVSSISVSWTPPDEKGDATGYRVYYASGDRILAAFVVWGAGDQAVLTDDAGDPFLPSTEYRFIVVTTDGTTAESANSNLASVVTPGDGSGGAGILLNDPRTATGWLLADPENSGFEGGILLADPRTATGYRLTDPVGQYSQTGSGLLLSDPRTTSGYRLSDPTGRVSSPDPVAAPTITRLDPNGSTSLSLQWVDNNTNGSDSFIISCIQVTTGESVTGYPLQVAGSFSSYIIYGLSPSTLYTVTVTAKIGVNNSDPSAPASANTSSDQSTGEWQLPTGYYEPSQMPLMLTYPHPDAGTDARHLWAHTKMEYSICVVAQGGAWPFRYQLLTGPTGMTIGETYGTTQSPLSGYGVVRWSGATLGAHTVSILITDQEGAQVQADFTITVDDDKFVFLEKGGGGSTGTYADPVDDISDILTGFAGKIAVFRDSGTQYTMPSVVDVTNYDDEVELNPSVTPMSFIAESYSSTASINFFERKCLYPNFRSDFLMYGLTTTGVMKGGAYVDGDPSKDGTGIDQNIIRAAGTRWAIHRCSFTDIQPNTGVDNTRGGNHSVHYIRHSPTSNWEHTSFVRNTLDNVDRLYSAFILYTNKYFVGELNIIKNSTNNNGQRPQGFLFTKGANKYVSIRANDCWENNAVDLVNLSAGSDGFSQPYPPANTNGIPHHEEVCWNKLQTSLDTNTICTHCAAHDNDSYNYYAYRNTVLGGQFNIHRWASPTNTTRVSGNVALNDAGGIVTWSGTDDRQNNIQGAATGQTVIDNASGLLISDTDRGTVGHEVYFPGTSPPGPGPTGDLYSNDFSDGVIYSPQLNILGVYSHYAFGIEEGYGSGIVSHAGKTALEIVSIPDTVNGGYNSGKFEIFWDIAVPDIYISFDVYFDADWQMQGSPAGHQKFVALWEEEYGSHANTDGENNYAYCVQELNFETGLQGACSIQTTQSDTYQATRFPWYLDPATQKSCTTSYPISAPIKCDGTPAWDYATLMTPGDLDKWINVQYHVRRAQNSSEKGLFEIWKDGALIMSADHENWTAESPRQGYRRMYLFGNASLGIVNQSSKYMANLQISTEKI